MRQGATCFYRWALDVPKETPHDLAERYRQLRGFDEAEVALAEALVKKPNRLDPGTEKLLRYGLNLSRLWAVGTASDGEIVVGPQLSAFRDRLRPLAERITKEKDPDPADLGPDVAALTSHILEAREMLLSRHSGRLLPSVLDRELSEKSLVLVLGGGGGCGYVHLGAFSVLQAIGITPRLIVGSSIGSVLGLFRSREVHFKDAMVRAVTHGLTFKNLFRVFDTEVRYGMPGTLRLYLRTALGRFFVGDNGETISIGEATIPFICVVSGIRREAMPKDIRRYESAIASQLRRGGAFGALLHVKEMIGTGTRLISELIATPGGLKPVPLGSDDLTREFDALDAVGFSCAIPPLIHYDILRDDPRMHQLMHAVLEKHGVDFLVDGGIASNVPARAAWESVQRGRIGTRNVLILGLDCFAPQLRRNMLYLPLQRIAAENVARDRAFAHRIFSYKKVLSPAALVPNARHVRQAVANGRAELETIAPLISKLLEPLDPL